MSFHVISVVKILLLVGGCRFESRQGLTNFDWTKVPDSVGIVKLFILIIGLF